MVSRPRTYAINEVIGTVSDGVPVVVLGVDVWMSRVVPSAGRTAYLVGDDTIG